MAYSRANPRCLFLSCSGVRVKSEELNRIGVTLPGFVERSVVIGSLPSLGLLTLAAHTPDGWDIEYRETGDVNVGDIAGAYDLVAISGVTAQIDAAYEIADQLRATGSSVVLGGLHVSACPQEAAAHCDAMVLGEGELAWELLCRDFEHGEMRPVYRSLDYGYFNFERARVPRFDLLDMHKYNRITVQTQRGCPRACHFCASSHTISNYKTKPVTKVIEEIEEISRYWPRPFIEFADDNTFIRRGWAKELMRHLIPLNIRWFTETDLSVAEDEELLDLMSRAGCFQLLIGLESSSSTALADADPTGWKRRQFAKYQSAIAKIQGHGVSVNGCFVLGWDSDDRSVFDRTRRFIEELGLAEVQVTLLTPFPNTPLYRRLENDGRLFKQRFWDECTLFDLTFRPAKMTASELESGLYWLFSEIYNAKASSTRHRIFRDCVRRKHRLGRTPPTSPLEPDQGGASEPTVSLEPPLL